MNVKKITEVRIAPSPMPWSCAGGSPQTLTLEGGEKFSMADRHLGGIVPVAGDWLIDGEIFQNYEIVKTELRPNGETVLICGNGLRVGPSEFNASLGPVPQVGDYLIRKTSGYCVISRFAFQQTHALVLGELKKRASDSVARSREQAKSRRNLLSARVKARKARA